MLTGVVQKVKALDQQFDQLRASFKTAQNKIASRVCHLQCLTPPRAAVSAVMGCGLRELLWGVLPCPLLCAVCCDGHELL